MAKLVYTCMNSSCTKYSLEVSCDSDYGDGLYLCAVCQSPLKHIRTENPNAGQAVASGAFGGALIGAIVGGIPGAILGAIVGSAVGSSTYEKDRRKREFEGLL